MTEQNQKQLGNTLWAIADQLRGAMDADDFRDYMLSFLFLRYLSDNYETAAKKELGSDYPKVEKKDDNSARPVPLALWYANNPADVTAFEKQMRRKVHYVVQPQHLWSSIANMARTQSDELLNTLQAGFKYIETESFESTFQGLFSEIDLGSSKLGKGYPERNAKLCNIIKKIADGLAEFSDKLDTLGDAYEYLIGQFAAGSGKKAGEFYTPQQISDILSAIVTLDSQEPKTGVKQRLDSVMDFACGSGSLLLNVRKKTKEAGGTIGRIYGQEKNITTYNLARMNMLLHGVKDTEFEIFHGDTLTNDWDILRELNPAKKPAFDAIVANPPFSYRWEPTEAMGDDVRFKNHGLAPKSAADFAFLLHGFHFLKDEGVMAIILPHGVLFRGNAEADIRKNLIRRGYIKAIIGLPPNLFYGTGIPACIVVIDKENAAARRGIFMIDASKGFIKDGNKNRLRERDLHQIVDVFTNAEEHPGYSRLVPQNEIEKNDFNLNLPRYIDTQEAEDIQDIGGHLLGGIPNRDVDALHEYWDICPELRAALFKRNRTGYVSLRTPASQIKPLIHDHPQFAGFIAGLGTHFKKWRKNAAISLRTSIQLDCLPRQVIHDLSENLLHHAESQLLIDPYAVYQHLMDYWAATLQDDCYLIAADGWVARTSRVLETDKKGKTKDKGWTCDLSPKPLVVARYFSAEQADIEACMADLEGTTATLAELEEEHGGEDGFLGALEKINKAEVNTRLKELRLGNAKPQLSANKKKAAELGLSAPGEDACRGRQMVTNPRHRRAGRAGPRLPDPHWPHPPARRPLRRPVTANRR